MVVTTASQIVPHGLRRVAACRPALTNLGRCLSDVRDHVTWASLIGRRTPAVSSSAMRTSRFTHDPISFPQPSHNFQTGNRRKLTSATMGSPDGVTGDFKDKQFAKNEVADKVVEQYDEKQARVFYKYVMVRFVRLHDAEDTKRVRHSFTHSAVKPNVS